MICNDFHSSPMSPVNQNRCPTNLPGTANERMILSCGIMVSPLPWVLIPRTAPGICGRDCGFYMASSNTWFFSHIHKGLGNPNIQSIGIKEAAFVQQPFAPQNLHVVFAWKVTYNLFDLFSVLCREHKMSALQPAKPQRNTKQAAEFRLTSAKAFWSKQSTSFLSLPANGQISCGTYLYIYIDRYIMIYIYIHVNYIILQ